MAFCRDPELLPEAALTDSGPLQAAFRVHGAQSFRQAARWIQGLPFRRPVRSVLAESVGTCSSKHGALRALARELGLAVELREASFEVVLEKVASLAPDVASRMMALGLESFVECHSFLAVQQKRFDLTWEADGSEHCLRLLGPIVREWTIEPEDLPGKPGRHRTLMMNRISPRPEIEWTIREAFIESLSQAHVENDCLEVATADDVLPLRHHVLRPMQGPEAAVYPHDDDARTLHLKIVNAQGVVAIGSVMPEGHADEPSGGFRIRGMASVPEVRGRGFGSRILRALVSESARLGARYAWCNARIGAVTLYQRLGFAVVSERFDLPPIGPHYRMMRRLDGRRAAAPKI
ncbi:MAG: GNAT family N-acetyltransferase [Myxococcota bacterium]